MCTVPGRVKAGVALRSVPRRSTRRPAPGSHRARAENLVELGRELIRIQPLESLLGQVAEACGRLLDSESVGIRIRRGDDLILSGIYGDAREAMPTTRLKVGDSLSGIVAATGRPLAVNG